MENAPLTGFYRHVEEAGLLRTEEHARRWTDAVMRTLGQQLDRRTKKALAEALPEELSQPLTRVFWLLHFRDPQYSAREFHKKVALRAGNSDPVFARVPIHAVLTGVRRLIDADLDRRVAETLSPELRELWQEAA